MAMCPIYLLAGVFRHCGQGHRRVDATVASALPSFRLVPAAGLSSSLPSLPPPWVPPWAPSAPWRRWRLGVAQAAGIDPMLMAGTIPPAPRFGDNLSIISDTTIAATAARAAR